MWDFLPVVEKSRKGVLGFTVYVGSRCHASLLLVC